MKLRLAQKLMLMILVIVLVSVTSVTVISVIRSSRSITDVAKTDLEHLAKMARSACVLARETALAKVQSDLNTARLLFQQYSKGKVEVQNGQMIIDPDGRHMVINNNFEIVDKIQEMTGSSATIFIKEGGSAKRISTNVKDANGQRAVGTYIAQNVYDAVVGKGQTYVGRAMVVTDWQTTAYEPIRDARNEIIGILYVGTKERSDALRNAILAHKVGTTGYIYVINSSGILQIHPAKEGSDLSQYDFIKEIIAQAPKLPDGEVGWIVYPWINKELGETKARDKIVSYTYFKEWDWIVAAGSYLEEFTAPVNAIRNSMTILGIIFLLGSLAVAWLFARSITRPVVKLVGAAEAISMGDVSMSIDVKTSDEVGVLADSFRNMIGYMQHVADVARRISENDLRVEVEPKSDKDVLGNAFKLMVKNLTDMVARLRDSANELVSAATEIASTSEQMSRGSQQQSDQIGQVSTAVEEMSATILEAAKNASEAQKSSKNASSTAGTGGRIVQDTITGMQRISEVVNQSSQSIGKLATSASQIGEIIGVINDIADQTNLLALNAAIEAARAGEQGRGFAVVADEVRKLAERTGKATGEIADMIKGIQKETEEAVSSMQSGIKEVEGGRQLADKAGQSLNEIVTMSEQVMAMIQQIATASEEQSAAAEQISKNMDSIASVTKESAKGAEQAAAASEQLSRQAEELKNMISQFKIHESREAEPVTVERKHAAPRTAKK